MSEFNFKLTIKIPQVCNCEHDCICKEYIKCKNDCICGSVKQNKQLRLSHSALTPDYGIPVKKLKRSSSNVSFGPVEKIIVEKLIYHPPAFFDMIRLTTIIKNNNLSPRCYTAPRCYAREGKTELSPVPGSV